MDISPELIARARRGPADEVVDLVLTGDRLGDATLRALKSAGFEVCDDSALKEFGVIMGRARLGDIESLLKIEGIESVEEETEQGML